MEENELSFGEKLVGLNFNPGGDDKVKKAKELFAEVANMLEEARVSNFKEGTYTSMHDLIYKNAVSEVLNAQMNVVKFLTFKAQ